MFYQISEYLLFIISCLGPKKQDFGPTANILKGNHDTFLIHLDAVCQKFGQMRFENNVFQKVQVLLNYYFMESLSDANFISAHFITFIFQNIPYLLYANFGLFISLMQFFGQKIAIKLRY